MSVYSKVNIIQTLLLPLGLGFNMASCFDGRSFPCGSPLYACSLCHRLEPGWQDVGQHKLNSNSTQTFYWTTMKSGFAKIQTYNKHAHRHKRKWNEMRACRRNNNLDIRYAVRVIPIFLSCTRVYWYSRSNFKSCSLLCSVGTSVYINVLDF